MRRSDEVLRHAPAFCVHEAEVELGFGNPLLCGLAELLHRLGVVQRYALALVVPTRSSECPLVAISGLFPEG